MNNTPTPTTGELLDDLRNTMDVIDELNASIKAASKQRKAIEAKLQKMAESAGVDSFSNAQISVSFKEDFAAAYDPESWTDLMKWAVETGNFQLIQRRISTKPVKELIDNGMELPVGVRLEPLTRMNVRRK